MHPRWFYGYAIVAAGFLVQFLLWGSYYAFGVFLVPITEEFDWSRTLVAGAYMLSTILFGACGIIVGRLADTFGPRLVVSACCLLSGGGYIMMAFIDSEWQLYLALGVLIGVGLSGSYVPLSATIARWFIDRRGTMTGVMVSGAGVGTMIAPLLANLLINRFDWRAAYLIIGVASLAITLTAAQFLAGSPETRGLRPYRRPSATESRPAVDPPVVGLAMAQVIRLPVFWIVALVWFLHGFFGTGLTVHLFAHVTSLGISDGTAATLLGALGALGIAGSFVGGFAADRFGTRAALFGGYALSALAILILIPAGSVLMFVLVVTLFGLGWYAIATLIPLISADLFGVKELGLILGFVELAWAVGGGVGPVLLGLVFDTTGDYTLGFVGLCAMAVVATGATLLIRPPRVPDFAVHSV